MPIAETAATASMTLPGPTGNPAARKVRAKCIRLASSRPWGSDAAAIARLCVAMSACKIDCGFGLDLFEQPGDVVLVFQQHAQGVVDRVRRQLQYVELHQRLGPVDRLGDAGKLEQIHRAQLLDKADDLARQAFAGAGCLAL